MADTLSYISYDFDDVKQELIDRLKVNDAWKDTYESSTGMMIIEFYAYVANLILYLLERRAEECFIATAQNKSSVINLVKLINYSPKRKVSATGTLQFSIAATSTKIIYISKYTECQSVDGVKYLTNKDVSIPPVALSATADGVQGELIDQLFTSDGIANQEFSITDTAVEDTNYFVYVDDEEWTEVSTFISSTSTSKHYRLVHELDDTLTLIFGDNVRGMIPVSGAEIKFEYIRSDGVDGNVYQTGRITTVNDKVYNEDGTEVTVTVTNPTTFTGGDNAEDIEEIRSEAPKVFATGDRAVTRDDFKAILRNYPSIADANAWGENEEDAPDYDMLNRVNLCIVLEDWKYPTTSFITTLGTYLYTKSTLTVKYESILATFLNVIPTIELFVEAGYSLSKAQADTEAILATRFVLGSTTKLGTSQKLSNLVAYVDDLASVAYHHMTLEIRRDLTASLASGYDYSYVLEAVPIKAGSVKVYANIAGTGNDVLMATDDSNEAFTDSSSSYVVTGTIDYTTGEVNVEFEPDTYISGVYIRYQQDADGDIDVTENQICELYEVDITAIQYAT